MKTKVFCFFWSNGCSCHAQNLISSSIGRHKSNKENPKSLRGLVIEIFFLYSHRIHVWMYWIWSDWKTSFLDFARKQSKMVDSVLCQKVCAWNFASFTKDRFEIGLGTSKKIRKNAFCKQANKLIIKKSEKRDIVETSSFL